MMNRKFLICFLLGFVILVNGVGLANEVQAEEVEQEKVRIEVPAVPFVGIPIKDEPGETDKVIDDSKSSAQSAAPEVYTFEFEAVPVYAALRAIAKKTGSNIVAHSGLDGTVSLSLVDVTLEEALDIIARTHGLAYTKEGNIYIFGPASMFTGDQQMVQRMYTLQNTTVDSIKPLLEALVGPDMTFVVDELSRSVIVRGPAAFVDRMIEAVRYADQEQRQVMLMTSVLEITEGDMKKLGINFSRPATTTPSNNAGGSGQAPPGNADGITVTLLDGIIDLFSTPFHMLGTTFELQARLDALSTTQRANLLATPSLATLNGREATIFLGDQIPIVSTYIDEEGRELPTGEPEWKNVGIEMTYIPWINEKDEITLELTANIQSVDAYVHGYPQIVSREVKTTIRAKNGQPIVIGGLFRKNEIEELRKIALLGDLPILGALFRNKETRTEESEVIIVLVPYII